MKRISLVLALVLAAVVAPLSLSAQRSPVRGHIVGEDGKPLAGADIVLVNKENGQKFTMKTDKKGDFLNIGVVLGVYRMTVSKEGKTWQSVEMRSSKKSTSPRPRKSPGRRR
jgi:hypothetical protein